MDRLIFGIWGTLFLAIPIALIVTSHYKSTLGGKPSHTFLKLLFGLFSYIIITLLTIPFLFAIIWAEAHDETARNGFNLARGFIYLGVVLIYGSIGWLLCSLIYGKPLIPKFNTNQNSEKTETDSD